MAKPDTNLGRSQKIGPVVGLAWPRRRPNAKNSRPFSPSPPPPSSASCKHENPHLSLASPSVIRSAAECLSGNQRNSASSSGWERAVSCFCVLHSWWKVGRHEYDNVWTHETSARNCEVPAVCSRSFFVADFMWILAGSQPVTASSHLISSMVRPTRVCAFSLGS